MQTVALPMALLQTLGKLSTDDLAKEAAKLLTLEHFREDRISLGRAAELSQTSVESFMQFAGEHDVPLHYGITELEDDRRTLVRLRS